MDLMLLKGLLVVDLLLLRMVDHLLLRLGVLNGLLGSGDRKRRLRCAQIGHRRVLGGRKIDDENGATWLDLDHVAAVVGHAD